MRGTDCVRGIRFEDEAGNPIFDAQAQPLKRGKEREFKLEPGEKIIGVSGVHNYDPKIVGLSFLIWKPDTPPSSSQYYPERPESSDFRSDN